MLGDLAVLIKAEDVKGDLLTSPGEIVNRLQEYLVTVLECTDVSGAAILEPQPVRAVPSMARASVRERIFFILSNLLGDWAFFRLPLAV